MNTTAILCVLSSVFVAITPDLANADTLQWDLEFGPGNNGPQPDPGTGTFSGVWENEGASPENENWFDPDDNRNEEFENDSDDEVFFGDAAAPLGGTPATVTVVGTVAPAAITFGEPGYTIEGGTLYVGGDAGFGSVDTLAIEVASGSAVVNSDLVIEDDVTVNVAGGAGVLTLGGSTTGADTTVALITVGGGGLVVSGTINDNVTNDGGTVTVDGTVAAVTASDGDTINNGQINGATVVDGAGATFENNSALNATLEVSAGSFDNETGGTVDGLSTISGTGIVNANGGDFAGGILLNGGTLEVNEDTADAGQVTNNGGTVNVDPTRTLTTTLFEHQGGNTNVSGTIAGPVEVEGGDAANSFNNNGVVAGAVTVTDGVFNNGSADGTTPGDVQGTVDVAGAAAVFNHNAGSNITDTLTIGAGDAGGTVEANGGTFGGDIIVESGAFNVNADLDTVATGSALDNRGGDVVVGEGVTLTTDLTQSGGRTIISGTTPANRGTIIDADGFDVTAGEVLNSGQMTGAVNVSGAGSVTNEANGLIDDLVTVEDDGTLNAAGGTFTTGIDAQGGNINITADSTFTTFDLDNQGATVDIASGVELTDDVTNTSGDMSSSGLITGTLDIDGGSFTQNADSGPTDGVSGDVTVAGGIMNAEGGTFASGIDVAPGGTLNVGDGVAGDADVTADVVNTGGAVNILTDGQLTGGIENSAGDTDIADGGVLSGGVVLTGPDASSSLTVAGVIADGPAGGTDVVDQQGGTLTLDGENADIQIAVDQTGGAIVANEGAFSGGVTGTSGSIDINGDVSGDVSVEGSAFAINTGGNLTGNVTMTTGATIAGTNDGTLTGTLFADVGTFENNGAIPGPTGGGNAIEINGGVVNNNTGGTVDGATVLRDGTLNANGGDFAGGITVQQVGPAVSALNVNDDLAGDITNGGLAPAVPGGTVTINAGNAVDGTVTNNAGSTIVSGRVDDVLNVAGGTVTTNAGSAVGQGTNVSDGTLTANGGSFEGGINATGGQVDVDGDIAIGAGAALVADDGLVDIDAGVTVTGDVQANNSGGTADSVVTNAGIITGAVTVGTLTEGGAGASFVNTGTVDSALTVNNGTAENNTGGMLDGGVSVTDGGVFTLNDGAIGAASTVETGGTFDVLGGSFVPGIDNDGGTINVDASATGAIRNSVGDTVIAAPATLTGAVTNGDDGTLDLDGTISGTLDNDGGIVNAAGTVTSAATNANTAGGAGPEDGKIVVATGDIADFTGGLTNSDGGELQISGRLNGPVTNADDGIVTVTGGTLGGALQNAGEATFAGASTAADVLDNTGTLNIGSAGLGVGALNVTGTLTNQATGTLNVGAGSTLTSANPITNNGLIDLSGSILSRLDNNSQIDVNGGSFGGPVNNSSAGTITLNGTAGPDMLNFGGDLSNTGLIDLSTGTPDVGDMLVVNGALSGNGRYAMDVNLSDTDSGTDTIQVVGGAATGNWVIDFNVLESGGEPGDQIRVVDVDSGFNAANTYDLTFTGLPDFGEPIVYVPSQITEAGNPDQGDFFIQNALNPGIGALAGSIVLTQSLIGSVINRPSSPFVSGLAYDDPQPCGPGLWARGIGGQADSSGEVAEQNENGFSFDGEISADYYGLQGGGDLACFNGYFDGWDISAGAIGGFNEGSTEQPVFALVGDGAGGLVVGDQLTSVTRVQFDQTYGGVYLTGARNQFSVDLQYRLEQTNFVANNEGAGGFSGLGLEESAFSSEASTFSGSISYAVPFGENNLSFIPTGGFAYTQVATDRISFSDGSSVQVEDFTSETLFIGGTISRTSFGEDGTSALNQFGTVTFYNDFAEAPTSVYSPDAASGEAPRSVVGENLGGYGEISAGLNYLQILQPGAPLGAKQISASIRGDLRGSDQLQSWGLTTQFRVQF
ncbi:hypothetical protein [Yoonia sp. SS1-5]|uniref:Autotransporter domain-containing protein n=1 Tax=Yoonia rhodophyticola TaxID=3137370 RepID=A0AAN0MAH4_9RHOB